MTPDRPLPNSGKIAEPDGIVYGYECAYLTLCAPCAQETTVAGKPFIGYENHKTDTFVEAITSYTDPPTVDSPLHCFTCGALIPTRLTEEGLAYVRDYCARHDHPDTTLYNAVAPLYHEVFPQAFA